MGNNADYKFMLKVEPYSEKIYYFYTFKELKKFADDVYNTALDNGWYFIYYCLNQYNCWERIPSGIFEDTPLPYFE